MSSLLEQAIIDAKALKDAALKNAEQLVIEKYSDQIKEAVTSFLEEEEDDMEMDAMADLASEEPESGEVSISDESDDEAMDSIASSDSAEVELDLDAIEKRIREIEDEESRS